MLKKLYIALVLIIACSSMMRAQSVATNSNDVLVMSEKDLEHALKRIAIAEMEADRQQAVGQPMQQMDPALQYRFDRLESLLLGAMANNGGTNRNLIIDRNTGGATPFIYSANGQQIPVQNFEPFQKQLDLLHEQIVLLAQKIDDNDTKAKLDAINNELDNLKNGLKPQVVADTVVEVKESVVVNEIENLDNYKRQVFFEVSSTKLSTEALNTLSSVVDILTKYPTLAVNISGYASPEGNTAYNNRLSQRRAQAVKDYLVGKNIEANRLNVIQQGEDRVSDMRTYGRRVDITVIKK